MQDFVEKRVGVVLTHLKRLEEHILVYEALALVPPDDPFSPILPSQGAIPMCPVRVFPLLCERAHLRDEATLGGCKRKPLQRRMEQLFEVAHIDIGVEG